MHAEESCVEVADVRNYADSLRAVGVVAETVLAVAGHVGFVEKVVSKLVHVVRIGKTAGYSGDYDFFA